MPVAIFRYPRIPSRTSSIGPGKADVFRTSAHAKQSHLQAARPPFTQRVAVRPGSGDSRCHTSPIRAALQAPAYPCHRPYTAVMIIPTGVGAAIGGFAGDALPVARALASIVDCLITHPNVLNGAMLYWPCANALYVEGAGLDHFAGGDWGLSPVVSNRVGLVLDRGMEVELRVRHCQVADAARATLGVDVVGYTITDAALQVEKWVDPLTGQSTGRLGRPDSLLQAVEVLRCDHAVDAVAVVARFPDDCLDDIAEYRQGEGVDALAGVEAVISHLVVERFLIPCAHAPALAPIPIDATIAPRSAAEELGYTFLPCVLAGLTRAPRFVERGGGGGGGGTVWAEDVDCVVVPASACGGPAVQRLSKRSGKPPLIIAVAENETVLDGYPEKAGVKALLVANYWEALGVVAAHKAGLDPWALRRGAIGHIPYLGPRDSDVEDKQNCIKGMTQDSSIGDVQNVKDTKEEIALLGLTI